jgi:hypothetical protein
MRVPVSGLARPRQGYSLDDMTDDSLKGRVTRQSEEAIGRFAQELLDNPLVGSALSRAFETRERAMRAQEVAMGALNLPSAADLERLTRRVRSVSQRLESIEDSLDRLEGRLAPPATERRLEERLERIEALLERLVGERAAPAPGVPAADAPAADAPAPGAPGPGAPGPGAPGPGAPRPGAPAKPRARRARPAAG